MKFYPKAAIDAAAVFAGKEASRFVLNSVQFKADGRMVACDGRRLIAFTPAECSDGTVRERLAAALESAPNGKDECMVDARSLKDATAKSDLVGIRTDGKTATIATTKDAGRAHAPVPVTALPVTEGVFPDVDQIVPKGHKGVRVGFNARLLGEALRALAPLASHEYGTVTFTFAEEDPCRKAVLMECENGDGKTVAVIMPILIEDPTA